MEGSEVEYKFNSGIWGTMFGVPNVVADNFLKLATGDQLKVLLYLLRCSGNNTSAKEISANTGVKPNEVCDAILFWQQVNVITSDGDIQPQNMMSAPADLMTPPQPDMTEPELSVQATAPKETIRKRQNLYPSDISEMIKKEPEVAQLFKVAEETLGTLNNTMQNSLIWMMNYLGLKNEVIIVLINYCAMIEKTHPKYIEEIAVAWSEKEINTLQLAQEEVERMAESRSFTHTIMKMFEMNRKPTTKQLEFIEIWRSEGYSTELIRLAYEKTIEQIDKLNFAYINKILSSWKESGFTTTDDVKNSEADFRKGKKSGKDNSDGFNADKYKILINNI